MESLQNVLQYFLPALGIAGFLACGIGWWRAFGRIAKGQPILPFEPRREVPWGFLEVVFAFLLSIGIQLLFWHLLARLYGFDVKTKLADLPPDVVAAVLISNSIGQLTLVAAIALTILLRRDKTRRPPGVRPARLLPARLLHDLRIGAGAFCMVVVPSLLVQWLMITSLRKWLPKDNLLYPEEQTTVRLLEAEPHAYLFVAAGISAVIAAPLLEEFLFRMLLQGWLERFYSRRGDSRTLLYGGPSDPDRLPEASGIEKPRSSKQTPGKEDKQRVLVMPILISAGIFAGLHGWPHCVALFLLALGLGYLYQRTHRLAPCIIVHFMLNAFSFLILLLRIVFKIE